MKFSFLIRTIRRWLVKFFYKLGLNRFKILRKYYSLFLSIRLPVPSTVQGFKVVRAPMWLYLAGVHEQGTTQLCKKVIKKDWTIIDLGAQYGYYTLLFAKLIGPTGVVFSFEPNKESHYDLIRNIKINHLPNVIPINKAVSDRSGIENFFPGSSSFYKINKEHSVLTKVGATCLDDFFKDYSGEIHFMKIDIEGAEKKALRGMENILRKNYNIKIVIELSLKILDEIGIDSNKLLNQLRAYGFYLYKIRNDGTIIQSSNDEIINHIKGGGHNNIFCSREIISL